MEYIVNCNNDRFKHVKSDEHGKNLIKIKKIGIESESMDLASPKRKVEISHIEEDYHEVHYVLGYN